MGVDGVGGDGNFSSMTCTESLARWFRLTLLPLSHFLSQTNLCFSDCFAGDHSFEDIGLAAGRSQREKKRSYKDFLREEEEIAAQVRNSSKKKLKVNSKHLN